LHFSKQALLGFYGTCESQVFWGGLRKNLHVSAGWFDSPTGVQLSGHIFCAEKSDYYELTDNLQKSDAADPKITAQFYI